MNRPMRVALLTSARSWRGSGVSLGKIGAGLAARGHEVCAYTGEPSVAEGFAGSGLKVGLTPTRDTGLREIRGFRRRLREFGPEAVIVDKLRDLRLAGWGSLGLGVAILYRYNISTLGTPPRLTDRFVLLARTRMCLYQAEAVRDHALARSPALRRLPSRVIYNGYDAERYRPDREAGARFRAAHAIPSGRLVVLTVSALERAKGQDLALQALQRLQAGGADPVYVLVGDGKHAEQMRDRARHSGVATIFTGFLRGTQVLEALNAADVYLHPAREEIFPNAIAEAMACARPVVATRVGGVPELLGAEGEAGLLAPVEDVDALAAALQRCAAEPALRASLGAAGRQRIETRFPMSAMVDGYERAVLAAIGS
ncbi:MAG TPA: glycosyltransferase family 4 protein [Gemmatimonadales bacterium]|nr:glycosyltransferase family 4 protein [Gemmatimonadales bacterium]